MVMMVVYIWISHLVSFEQERTIISYGEINNNFHSIAKDMDVSARFITKLTALKLLTY